MKRPRRRATRSVVSTAPAAPIVVGPSDAPSTPSGSQPVTTGGTAAVATGSAAAEPAVRRPRRRATRDVSAPAPGATPSADVPADETNVTAPTAPEPAVHPAPVAEDVEADVAEPTGTGAPEVADVPPVAEPVAQPVADATPEAGPADESAAPAPLDLELPEPVTSAETQAHEVASLDDIVLPGGPENEKAAPRRRTRRKAAPAKAVEAPAEPAAEPATTEPATTEPASAEPTSAEPAAEAPKRTRSRRKPAAQAAEAPAEPAAAPAEEPAPKARARRSRRASSAEEAAPGQPATEPTAQQTTAQQPANEQTPASPAATASGTRTPRLATTALLFQAPDDSAARRPRRAQAPAGPPRDLTPQFARPVPRPVEEAPARPAEAPAARAATDKPATEKTATEKPATEAPAAETAEAPAPRTRRSGSRRAVRRSGQAAPEQAETQRPEAQQPEAQAGAEPEARPADDGATSASSSSPQLAVPELSADDAAAVDEVAAIEDELVAEGVELEELAPEDFEEYDDEEVRPSRRRRRRGGRGRRGGRTGRSDEQDDSADEADDQGDEQDDDAQSSSDEAETDSDADNEAEGDGEGGSRRRRRRRRGTRGERAEAAAARSGRSDEVTALKGSTRLEAKKQRRREGRDHGRRRQIITEAEFLARRESVQRSMIVREKNGRTQIAVLEDGVLVEHYVSQQSQASMAGNVYLGRVQNVLPSMEAAFVDVGKGRNAVLYAGEVNWDAAGLEGQPRRIEQALKSGDSVLVQVTKDPIGHKGARLTSQITLAGRYLVFVPGGGMTGISRKLPDTERSRLKKILREVVPDGAGVIVRTAAEGASEDELRADVERLQGQWDAIQAKSKKASAPALLQGEPDMAIRVVRDIFNDDFSSLVVQGENAWDEIAHYVEELAPDLRERVSKWAENTDVFAVHRVDEQLAKGMDRKVWLPSGGSLVIDRTEAMTVVDVNTGKFTGAGGTLEETVTRNNLEAAEEIVRQLRLRDIGGIIVIDFIDMVLESNRDLVLRRLVECLGRDRTKHQVAEVTSLGLVQMTRKRVGQGLVEAFSETCEHCKGRGFIVHEEPIEKSGSGAASSDEGPRSARARRKRGKDKAVATPEPAAPVASLPEERSEAREAVKATLATIAAAAQHAHEAKEPAPEGPMSLDEIQLPTAGSASSAEPAPEQPAPTSDTPEGGSGPEQPEPPKGAGDEVA
ncbi:MAG TPA: Rne/Rng family ribonuclease [Promicromonospora sp.]|nr:Rne/Rng family ribonuclease [Promicromonospora sp.]